MEGMAMRTIFCSLAYGAIWKVSFLKLYCFLLAVLAYSWLGELPVYAYAAPCCISQLCCYLLVSYIFQLAIYYSSMISSCHLSLVLKLMNKHHQLINYHRYAFYCKLQKVPIEWCEIIFTLSSSFSFDFMGKVIREDRF